MNTKAVYLAGAAVALTLNLPLHADVAAELASRVRADIAVLASAPTLAAWKKSHPRDTVQRAHYDTEKDPFEVDFRRMSRWCAASVGNVSSGVVRTALFYLPAVAPRALASLPAAEDRALINTCRTQALWYQTSPDVSVDRLASELSASWGKPNGATTAPDIPGSGFWKGFAWRLRGINVWAVYDPKGKPGGVSDVPRLVVYARRDMPRDVGDLGISLFTAAFRERLIDAAAQLATQNPVRTAAILGRSRCLAGAMKQEPESVTVTRLRTWLKAGADAASSERAAALVVAHAYASCPQVRPQALASVGVTLGAGCPQDGPAYDGSLLRRAEKIDATGPAGELAGLISLGEPCLLKGRGPWPDLAIQKGEKLLSQFPSDQWTPWIHFAVASAHAAKLSFAYPGGDPEGEVFPLSSPSKQRERSAAIEHFEAFL